MGSFAFMFVVMGLNIAIFLTGYFIGGEVSKAAGYALGTTLVILSWAFFQWRWGGFSDSPGPIKISAVILILIVISRTMYLLLA